MEVEQDPFLYVFLLWLETYAITLDGFHSGFTFLICSWNI